VPGFVSGLQLSHDYYEEIVRPFLAASYPRLAYAAALLGPGSEVQGYDTPISTDHDWGPRLFLFLAERDHTRLAPQLERALEEALPATFKGYPTRFDRSSEPLTSAIRHRVEVRTAPGYFGARLGCDPMGALSSADWLTVPEQTLLELIGGEVYHDGVGELTALRKSLAYYPRDLWLYRMAMLWRRIAQREAFVGRAGDVGDEVGSSLIAAGIVRDLMRLCLAIERRYAPYEKWFGTAFARLDCGPALGPRLRAVLKADDWRDREARLAEVYVAVLELHNGLAVTPPIETTMVPYFDRPFLVPRADRVVEALREAIADPAIRALPLCGGVDQLSDSTDFLGRNELRGQLRSLYQG
jgi:hypothetical protein